MTSGGYDPEKNPQGGQPYGQPNPPGGEQYGQPQYGQPQDPYPQSPDPYAQQQYGQPQYGQQQPGFGGPPAAGQPADLWIRLAARVIDNLIAFVPLFIIYLIFIAVSNVLAVLWALFAIPVLTFGYFVFMENSQGTTLGKKLLGMRVVPPGGAAKVETETSAKRNAFQLVSVVPCLGHLVAIGMMIYIAVTIEQDPNKQGWHDKFAGGTQVVKD